jgi:hypothetical protein
MKHRQEKRIWVRKRGNRKQTAPTKKLVSTTVEFQYLRVYDRKNILKILVVVERFLIPIEARQSLSYSGVCAD